MEFLYQKREVTLSSENALLYGLVFLIPLLMFLLLPYYLMWGDSINHKTFAAAIPDAIFVFLIVIIGVVLHELIHGLTWAIFCTDKLKSIKFGFMWKSLTPYCHCVERLKLNQYIIGGIMPAVLLGFLPSLFSLATGDLGLFLAGFFFSFASAGDFLVIWMLRKEPKETYVLDHPHKIGCFVFDKVADDCNC